MASIIANNLDIIIFPCVGQIINDWIGTFIFKVFLDLTINVKRLQCSKKVKK